PGPPMGGPPPGPPMGGPPPGPPMGGPPMGGPPMGGPPMGAPAAMAAGAGMMAPHMAGGIAPGGVASPAPMTGGGGGGLRPNFQGTGGELFVTFLVGYLLTVVTIGIYAPWFHCKLLNFMASN